MLSIHMYVYHNIVYHQVHDQFVPPLDTKNKKNPFYNYYEKCGVKTFVNIYSIAEMKKTLKIQNKI